MTWRIPDRVPEVFLIGAVVFGPLAFGAVEPWSRSLLTLLVCATLLCCGLRGLPDFSQSMYRTLLPSVLLLILLGLAQRLNPRSVFDPALPIPGTVSGSATGKALWVWATYAALLWCAPQALVGLASVRRMLATVFCLGCVVAMVGLIQLAQNRLLIYGLRPVPYGYEPFGPYYNRDHAASMLVMSAFCGGGLLWDGFINYERRRWAGIFDFAAAQLVIAFGILINLAGALCTQSRGALASLVITGSTLGFVAAWSRKQRLVWLGLVVAGTLLLAYFSPVATRLTSSYLTTSASIRASLYQAGLELFGDFPWLGSGLGAFQQAYYLYQPASITGLVEHVHSDWLELLLEAGVLGSLVFGSGLLLFFRSVVLRLGRPAEGSIRGLSWGAGASIMAFLIHTLVDFSFQIPANAVLFFVLLAVLGALAEEGSCRRRDSAPGFATRAAIASIALLLTAFSIPPAVASWYHLRTKGEVSTRRIEDLLAASAWDPVLRYQQELAKVQSALAPHDLEKRLAMLRKALAHSEAALRIDPANPWSRQVHGNLLWQLGRVADGKRLLED